MIKVCKCGFSGDESLFRKNRNQCKKCVNDTLKKWQDSNKEYISEYNKSRYRQDPCKFNKKTNEYKSKNKQKVLDRDCEYRKFNPIKTRASVLACKSLKGMPEELVKCQALINYINYELKKKESYEY